MEKNNDGRRYYGDDQDRRMGTVTVSLLALLAFGYGASVSAIQARQFIGENIGSDDGAEAPFQGERGMSVVRWVREKLAPGPSETIKKYERAIAVTDEVIAKFQERSASKDPICALMADIFLQHHDIALIADAFEMSQESRIYKGPPTA